MSGKLKCYMFFIKEDVYIKLASFNINNKSMSYDDNHSGLCLYGYTFNKRDAQEFKDMRNMDMFDIKIKKATKMDIDDMNMNFGLCELVNLTDVVPNADSDILVTREEYMSMQTIGRRKISHLNWDFDDYPDIYKNKYLKALSILKFRMMISEDSTFDLLIDKRIRIDYFSIFVIMFGKLLRADI